MSEGLLYKSQVRSLFHAHIKIKIPVFSDESLFDEYFGVLEDVDRIYNSYSEGSYFDLINKYAGEFVDVDDETIRILEQLIYFSELFDGSYDITIMPLIKLWGFYKDDIRRLPSEKEINETLNLVDYRKIEINDNRVRIAKGQEIITGSFMKSYAVDRLVERMGADNISDAIINAGGSTIMAISNQIHPYWVIDVKDPKLDDNSLFKLKIENMCFSTSAQTKTFVEIDGKQYGHILNPKTGYPSDNKQIGIVSDNCFIGDVISTGLYNLTPSDFLSKMEVLSEKFEVEGFLIDSNNSIHCSDGFQKYIIES